MTESGTRQAYPAAELDRRFYAYAVDRLIAWVVYAGAGIAAYYLLIEPGDTWLGIGLVAAVVLLVGLAFAVLLGVAGTSPGKALVGLRVVGHPGGAPIGVPSAVLRTLVLGVAALPTFGLGVATLAWTALSDPSGRRRGAHDRLTGAVVVDVRPQPEPEVEVDERPRQVVNLTAMRLMPVPAAPAEPPPTPLPQRIAPPPPSPGRHASPPPAPPTSPPPAAPPADRPPPTTEVPAAAPVATQRRADQSVRAGWRVTFDTGETFVVEGLALVGRRPEPRGGEPVRHLVPLRSADMSLSKTHAQFQVVPDGALVVMDRGSTNGSVVVRKGVTKPLTAGRPATLIDGDTVRFGDRSMTVVREA